jgi:hypothetical protein
MDKSMLLLDALPVGQMDFGQAVLNDGQRRLNEPHRILAVETGADAFGEMGVGYTAHDGASLAARPDLYRPRLVRYSH